MGGYGTVRIGMRQPGAFSALYAMSSCCLLNDLSQSDGPDAGEEAPTPAPGGGFANALFAQAAAWAPNPKNPPYFVDLPYDYDKGGIRPLIASKWAANSPVIMVDQYVPSLKAYEAIAIDIGDQDSGLESNRQLSEQLSRLGIDHTFEVYEGTHTSRVGARFETSVLPFFSRHLAGQ
jgi:S-formylglutathione hydrolase FrmB